MSMVVKRVLSLILLDFIFKIISLRVEHITTIIQNMESPKSTLSPNTLHRINRAQTPDLLNSYPAFKAQFQHKFSRERIENIKKVHQHGICGKNSFGHTIVVDRIGSIKIQNLTKVLDEEQLVAYTNQRLLHLAEQVLQQGEQVVWIIDLNGKLMQLASKKMLEAVQVIIGNMVKYFPLMLNRLVFVNTPMLFDTIWAKISHNIPKTTQEKIIMIGEDADDLYEFVQPEMLPEFLGGQLDQQSFLYGRQTKRREEVDDEESSEEEEVDFASLKNALGGLKISSGGLKSVSQTPLNTEADDK